VSVALSQRCVAILRTAYLSTRTIEGQMAKSEHYAGNFRPNPLTSPSFRACRILRHPTERWSQTG